MNCVTADYIRSNYMTNKTQLIEKITTKIRDIENGRNLKSHFSPGFYMRYLRLLKQFNERLLSTRLFNSLEDYWYYSCTLYDTKFVLNLNHVHTMKIDEDDNNSIEASYDQIFDLVVVNTQMLSVQEFAELHNMSEAGVRQLIRRGRLPNAVKVGNSWRIPELSEMTKQRRLQHHYYWGDDVESIPIEGQELKGFNRVVISPDSEKKDFYQVSFINDKKTFEDSQIQRLTEYAKAFSMMQKDKEKLETWLISNPMVLTPSSLIETIE